LAIELVVMPRCCLRPDSVAGLSRTASPVERGDGCNGGGMSKRL
jgi:hypothetical protein